jgi:hypothetical protein
MKTTIATLLALAGAAFAAPTATESASSTSPFPFSIDDVKLYHLKESNSWDFTIKVTSRDPYGAALGSTTCHSAWYLHPLPHSPASPTTEPEPY